MAARIRSKVNAAVPLDEVSRDDLVAADIVSVESLDAATTYAWALVYVPEGSTATFSGNPADVSPGSFTVDLEGAYLVQLIVDATLATEDIQYVRLRVLTTTLGLTLVAAGERRDGTGIIPVDIDTEGWANEQNANLLALEAAATVPDDQTIPLAVSPSNIVEHLYFAPYALTLVGIKIYAETTPTTAGVYTLAVEDADASNNLLAAATEDMTGLSAATLTTLTLTATTANLDLPVGTRIKVTLVSDNGDLVATGLYIQFLFRTQ